MRRKIRFLMTGGPTREFIDPVRFISSPSSGTMAGCLVRQALREGHKVTLLSGPVSVSYPVHPRLRILPIISAHHLFQHLQKEWPAHHDILIMAASVSDYTVLKPVREKIKKNRRRFTLHLMRTPDILTYAGQCKKSFQVVVGFSAESHRLLSSSFEKLQQKQCDLLVANSIDSFGTSKTKRGYILGYRNVVEKLYPTKMSLQSVEAPHSNPPPKRGRETTGNPRLSGINSTYHLLVKGGRGHPVVLKRIHNWSKERLARILLQLSIQTFNRKARSDR